MLNLLRHCAIFFMNIFDRHNFIYIGDDAFNQKKSTVYASIVCFITLKQVNDYVMIL